MGILLTVIFVILVVIFILLMIKASVKFEFESSKEEKLKLRVFFYSEKVGFNINLKNKEDEHKDDKPKESNNKEKNKKSILEKLTDLYKELQKIKYTQFASRDFIKKRLVLKTLNVNVDFGLSDAAKTGIATGALWSVIYNVFTYLTKYITVKNHEFKVNPDYNNEKFCLVADGILTVRIVNIISIALYVLIKYMKISKEYE